MTPTAGDSTRQRVAVGGVWMLANSAASRVIGFVGQLVLAWILLEEQFGLFALASGIAIVVDVVGQFGLSDVIVSRYRRFHLWGPPAFTISVILGLVAAIAMLLVAVLAAHIYKDADVGWLVATMAIAAPIRAVGIMPYSQLRAEMRFRAIAIVQSLQFFFYMGLTIVLALLGLGAYSFAWSKVASVTLVTASWISLAEVKLPRKLSFRGARYLIADSLHGYTNAICNSVITQADYLILGLIATKDIVGSYFLAFTISAQAISLIALNLTAVLFPAFSTLADYPDRQVAVFIRSSKMLAFICAPVCCLQAIVAAPLIPMILEPRWHDIVPLVQIISLGTAFRCTSYGWSALLKAQRRFSTTAMFSASASCVFPCVIAVSCYLGGVLGCAIGASLFYAVVCPLQLLVAIRKVDGAYKHVLDTCLRSLLIAGVTFGTAMLLASPARNAGMPILEMAIETVFGFLLYWALSSKLNLIPFEDMHELLHRLKEKFAISKAPTSKVANCQGGEIE